LHCNTQIKVQASRNSISYLVIVRFQCLFFKIRPWVF